jgi:predicted O-methyltransferase YrrM
MTESATFVDDRLLRVGNTEFHCDFGLAEVPPDRLAVMKPRALVTRYIELSQSLQPRIIVELGIHRGGSTALLNELNHPEKLIAFELHAGPPAALEDYVARQGLDDVVRTHFGIDQSDRTRLSEILDEELGSDRIDLVIDDASHLYRETVSSFETLFPRLRPGGLFVIEDWNANHLVADLIVHAVNESSSADREQIEHQLVATRDERLKQSGADGLIPFTTLAVELVLARASSGDAIRDVSFNDSWIVVRRGEDVLDAEAFRLADLVHDHHGFTEATR